MTGKRELLRKQRRLRRAPLMALAVTALLAGLWAGLVRLGWPLPALSVRLPAQHGPLMVSGFLGTLISLERAVAISHNQGGRHQLVYMPPLLAGLGGVALFFDLPLAVPAGLSTLGALGLVLVYALKSRPHPMAERWVMGAGALLWLAGNGMWLFGQPVARAVPWWIGFLVLTIAGERLELAQVLQLKRKARLTFLAVLAVFLVGLLFSWINWDSGVRLAGSGLILTGIWLLRFDVARRTIRRKGLTRFIAASLLLGYVWLVAGGLFWLVYGGQYTAGPVYDAMMHAIFLGFVFSMVFGHAPIILPAVTGIELPYSRIYYAHLGLLHGSLVYRLAGDLLFWPPARRWGGLFNELAVVMFLLVTAVTLLRASRKAQ